jgi:hypothetical protein
LNRSSSFSVAVYLKSYLAARLKDV